MPFQGRTLAIEGKLTDMSHILFPHTRITAPDLNRIINRFGHLTICQPWFMEGPLPATEKADLSSVDIQYPSTGLKPKGDFSKLISEYKQWVSQNQDRGYGTLMGASHKGSLSEDTPWEIRQLISKGGQDNPAPVEGLAFKWHLILHLAREFEQSSVETEQMLNALMHKKSPLEGALEETPPQRIFEDTPLMETQLHVGAYHLKQVFEAWFGLFGEYISDNVSLVTFDPLVIEYAAELLETDNKIIRAEGPKTEALSGDTRHLPRLPDNENASKHPVLAGLSGKTIILMED